MNFGNPIVYAMNYRCFILFQLFIFLSVQTVKAQNSRTQPKGIFSHPLYDQVVASSKTRNQQQTVNLASALLNQYSQNSIPYYYTAQALYFMQKNKEFFDYIKAAYEIEPYSEDHVYYMIQAAILNYDVAAAREAFDTFSFIYNKRYKGTIEQFNNILNHYAGYEQTRIMASQVRAEMKKYEANYNANIKFFYEKAGDAYQVGPEEFKAGKAPAAVSQLLALKPQVKSGYFPISLYNQILHNLSYWAFNMDMTIGAQLLPELYEQFRDKRTGTMMRYRLYVQIAKINQATRKYEDNLPVSNIMMQELSQASISKVPVLKVANFKMFALTQLSRYNEASALAEEALTLMPQIVDQEVKLEAYYSISRAISYNGNKEKGLMIAKEGAEYARAYGWENFELGTAVIKNYNTLRGFNGEEVEVTADINSEDHISLYDGGMAYVQAKQYARAIPFFEKSKQIYERQMANASEYDRRNMLGFYAKVGGNLVACYKETKAADEKLFAAMEDVKSNGVLSASAKKVSLADVQAALQKDEALVYYVDVSRSFTYEGIYMGAVITKTSFNTRYIVGNGTLMGTYMVYNDLIGEIEQELAQNEFRKPRYTRYEMGDPTLTQLKEGEFTLLSELYRKHIIGKEAYDNPDYLNEFAKSFYKGFVAPLASNFTGKKTLLFGLDGTLNFLPFESFKNEQGQYLIENYDIGYIPSATLMVEIRNRPEKTYTRNVLAFGDAKYAKLEDPGRKLESLADIDRLALDVRASLKKGEPLNYAFATFSKEAMNYLSGAKAEVEAIAKIVPGTDLKMDGLMTENEFKRMSQAGELKNYRAIHLSSHANVHPYVFDLSSIAFSVYPQARQGEDGMLTVSEMAQMNIETDFMMLSACQTGLGKLVPGEGVVGLNHSMLKAGANATLTSLWSVSDYGTSVFTVNLYHKIFNEGKSYIAAVSEVKRSFIKGEFNKEIDLSKPFYWSPFVYYGK
ncbi:MAG: hypothetical protein Roseis2KO_41360 [Roseivirga sp.]